MLVKKVSLAGPKGARIKKRLLINWFAVQVRTGAPLLQGFRQIWRNPVLLGGTKRSAKREACQPVCLVSPFATRGRPNISRLDRSPRRRTACVTASPEPNPTRLAASGVWFGGGGGGWPRVAQ